VDLNDPVATALRVADALDRARHRYALFGGLLLAAYGEPRETHDVDLAIVDLTADAARQVLDAAGLPGTVSFDDVTFGGLTVGRVALLGGEEDTGLKGDPANCSNPASSSPRFTACPSRSRTGTCEAGGRQSARAPPPVLDNQHSQT
jgi:hypothetical protein